MKEILSELKNYYGNRKDWWPSGRFPDKRWEICAGAILTQNTNWKNVEKALDLLAKNQIVSPQKTKSCSISKLESAVRPSGFYRQKAVRLKIFAKSVVDAGGMDLFSKNVTRDHLLSLNGIGNETADSILLYALGRKEFVVDAYTRRIFSRIGILDEEAKYMEIKKFFQKNFFSDYKEIHALIVEFAKEFCRKKPICESCPVKIKCDYNKRNLKSLKF